MEKEGWGAGGIHMTFIPQEIIRKKRDGLALTRTEIEAMVKGVTDESVSEGQVAAFAMAVFFQGMTMEEAHRPDPGHEKFGHSH